MAMEMVRNCGECGPERTFWRIASTNLHLGKKVKWHCTECGHRIVRIDGDVDTSASA